MLFPAKAFVFIADFIMLCSFALIYVLFLIAYSKGEIRWYTLLFPFIIYIIYISTPHKLFSSLFSFLTAPWAKFLQFLSKKLKNGKKSFKKLLHFC